MADIKLEQELEYYQSIEKDIIAEIMKERFTQRSNIQQLLLTKIPTVLESELSLDEQRLIRTARYGTPEDRLTAKEILDRLEHLRSGGCYGKFNYDPRKLGSQNKLFTFMVEGIDRTFCVNIDDVLERGMFNNNLIIADVNIVLPKTGEVYRYPLNEEDSNRLITQALLAGIDVDRYPQIKYSGLEEVKSQIASRRYQMGGY